MLNLNHVSIRSDLSTKMSMFGDAFISQIHYGGCLIANFTLSNVNNQSKEVIRAALKLAMTSGAMSGDISGEFGMDQMNKVYRQRMNITMTQRGGTNNFSSMPTNIKEIQDYTKSFVQTVATSDAPMFFDFYRYCELVKVQKSPGIAQQVYDMLLLEVYQKIAMVRSLNALMYKKAKQAQAQDVTDMRQITLDLEQAFMDVVGLKLTLDSCVKDKKLEEATGLVATTFDKTKKMYEFK